MAWVRCDSPLAEQFHNQGPPSGFCGKLAGTPQAPGNLCTPSGEAPLEALPPCDPEQLLPSSEGENSVQNLFLFPGRCSGNGSDSLRGEPDPLTTPLSRAVALVPSPVGEGSGRVLPGAGGVRLP